MEIVRVQPENLAVYLNLAQAYEAEFSAITRKRPDCDGMFSLDTKLGGDVVGYLLLEKFSPIGMAAVKCSVAGCEICEFYVVPSCRGCKAGARFAHRIWDLHAGAWQIKQIAGAAYATTFWQRTIASYRGTAYREDRYEDAYWGTVTRQRFEIARLEAAEFAVPV